MDGDFGDFNVGLFLIPTRPLEDRDVGDVFMAGTPGLLFTLSVAGGNSDVTAVSVHSLLSSIISSKSDLTGGSLGTRL